MKRYLRLYLYFIKFSMSKAMEFRVDFFFRVFMDLIFYFIQFLFFKIIYLHTPILGGWNQDQMTLFICSFIFSDAFHMTFFSNNSWWFPLSINRGDLDYYLVRPASSFFFMAFKEIAANSFLNLIIASVLLVYYLCLTPISYSAFDLTIFIALLINGAFLYFMIYLIFLIPVFWTHSDRGFADVFYAAEKISHRPDGIFQGYFRRFFLNILPFSIIASYPTRFLIEKNNQLEIISEIIFSSCFIYLIVYLMWKKGLKGYSSASS